MATFKPVFFDVLSDICVIDTNPEMADMSNPRGEIYGFKVQIRAQDSKGYTKISFFKTCRNIDELETYQEAEKVSNDYNAMISNDCVPSSVAKWRDGYPVYGSEAYLKESF